MKGSANTANASTLSATQPNRVLKLAECAQNLPAKRLLAAMGSLTCAHSWGTQDFRLFVPSVRGLDNQPTTLSQVKFLFLPFRGKGDAGATHQ